MKFQKRTHDILKIQFRETGILIIVQKMYDEIEERFKVCKLRVYQISSMLGLVAS